MLCLAGLAGLVYLDNIEELIDNAFKNIKVENFRNYENLDVNFNKKNTIFRTLTFYYITYIYFMIIHYIDFLCENSINLWSAYIVLPFTLE